MDRRLFLGGLTAAAASPVLLGARHGDWGSVDAANPWYLAGTVKEGHWTTPHAVLVIHPDDPLMLPADLRDRALPVQRARVDGAALLARTRLPHHTLTEWTLELAPPVLVHAWRIPRIAAGERVEAVGYPLRAADPLATVRVEYLFHAGRTYGLRSPPV